MRIDLGPEVLDNIPNRHGGRLSQAAVRHRDQAVRQRQQLIDVALLALSFADLRQQVIRAMRPDAARRAALGRIVHMIC